MNYQRDNLKELLHSVQELVSQLAPLRREVRQNSIDQAAQAARVAALDDKCKENKEELRERLDESLEAMREKLEQGLEALRERGEENLAGAESRIDLRVEGISSKMDTALAELKKASDERQQRELLAIKSKEDKERQDKQIEADLEKVRRSSRTTLWVAVLALVGTLVTVGGGIVVAVLSYS